ncbi:hypothetical protein EWH99_03435 [Sporolactobacillus sp. THM7-7]|nr:hypothetical protein EWH99_03435 [Sporolactobacillus sp. THM7-7]
MIIVYLSLVLVVAAIIAFTVSVGKTIRRMSGTVGKISATGEKMREQLEKIAAEKNRLTQNFSSIQIEFYRKKEAVHDLTLGVQKAAILAQENFNKVKTRVKEGGKV